MAGLYAEGESKVLSGVYSLILAISTSITSGGRGIVAYPFTADWGPVNELTAGNLRELRDNYNAVGSSLSVGKIYTHASNGEPKKVLGYRMATAEAKVAAATVDTWVFETVYPTTRPFVLVIKDGVEDGSIKISLVENAVELTSFLVSDVDSLVTMVNASDYIRVKTKGTTLPKANAGVEFKGGNNGDAVTVTNYTAFLDEIEADGTANAFSLDGVSDESIISTVIAWVKDVRQEGFYVSFVTGGPKAWDSATDTANAKSREINYRPVINVGNGCDGYTAAEMAIFVAARVAAVALNSSLTDETVPYQAVNVRLKKSVRERAKKAGTIIFVAKGDTVEIDDLRQAATALEEEGIEISAETGGCAGAAAADPQQLQRVFDNLLENSRKYAETVPLKIKLALSMTEKGYCIRFSDNGVGVPEEKLDAVFDEFYRADESRNKQEGNGLGLYIVRYLIEAMGGRVRAENAGGFVVSMELRKGES